MAATASPGTPKVSIGIRAPPVTPLLAASGAAIASGMPLPKSCGCLDIFFACPYAIKAAISAPAPGIIPIKVPIVPNKKPFLKITDQSCFLGITCETFLVKAFSLLNSSMPINAWLIAKSPIITGI